MVNGNVKVLDWPIDGEGHAPGFGHYVRARPTKRQLRDAMVDGTLWVKDDEQRGFDPVSGREILNEQKMKKWVEYEQDARLFLGQLNFALHTESGTNYELDNSRIGITGTVLMVDGRQRCYTIYRSVEDFEHYGHDDYNPDIAVEVTLWLDADSNTRKEIYAQLNGGRGGDHASKSSVRWMAPEGPLQETVKYLVQMSPHLGHENVNVKTDSVSKKDARLAGFHTFVKAFENAWGNRRYPTPDEIKGLKQFLVNFYDKLVEARPEMGRVYLGTRQKFRQEYITGSPLFIYGVMKVAVDLWWESGENADLGFLDTLKGEDGDRFLSLNNDEWRRRGILLPTYEPHTGEIRAWRITNSLQTRRAMAEAMHDRFQKQSEDRQGEAA